MSYRDRRGAKADRYREWADKREDKGKADYEQAGQMASIIPLGQPILVSHHSEGRDRNYRSRISNKYDRAFENLQKADTFRSRADEIERQMDRSIYSDDDDAIEKLEKRIADLEAHRNRIKAFNAAVRKGTPHVEALELVTAAEKADYLSTVKTAGFMLGKKGEYPAYHLTNLSGNINRNKKRLATLRAQQEKELS